MIRRSRSREIWCAALLMADLIFIWGNSLLPASVSGALSMWLKELLGLGGGSGGGDGLLRKLAHFSEFCLLGVLLSWWLGMRLKTLRSCVFPALIAGILIACVDETIQRFAAGRNPSMKDVGIDTAGLAVGILLLWLGHHIYKIKITNNIGGKQQ